jgi:transcriptional regulator with GAF, ATPase, and Fis domain
VPVNCGAIAETLLESELFGHVRGSFTGAISDTKGIFEQAHGGTVFLDEIGETSPALQVKLLRVLEEGEVRPVGASRTVRVDVRVVAATNADLEKERGRTALPHRTSTTAWRDRRSRMPPLRERREDIPLLASSSCENACGRAGARGADAGGAGGAAGYEWPGNVRELENTIERLVLFSRGSVVDLADLPAAFQRAAAGPRRQLFAGLPSLDELERRYLLHVLESGGRQPDARRRGDGRRPPHALPDGGAVRDRAVMEGIHLRDEERQRLQVGPFVATRSTARRSSMVASDGIRIAFRSGYPV